MKTSPLHSIRWRLQAWHGLILLVAITALCLAVHRLAWNEQLRRIDAAILENDKQLIRAFFDDLKPDNPENAPRQPPDAQLLARASTGALAIPASQAALFANTAPGHYWFIMRDAADRIILQSPNAPGNIPPPPATLQDNDELATTGHYRISQHRTRSGLSITYGRDIAPDFDAARRFGWSLAACGLGAWLLGLLGGWWIAGRAIRPISAISATATRIAAGNLSDRINTSDTDNELDQLGRVLNQTFDRLAASLQLQRQFTADASHELRTPLTILLAETQRALKRERAPAEYREILQTCHDTSVRMRALVEALLLLARQESPASALAATPGKTPCDLAEILANAAHQLAPLAKARHITIETRALAPAPCHADPDALGIVAANLISNAIHHHHPSGGSIRLKTGIDGACAFFIVEDDGPGIPAEDLPHVFERFYRADKSRTRADAAQTLHTGLGLAIVRRIVENHGGSVEARSESGKGATLEVRLPPAKNQSKN